MADSVRITDEAAVKTIEKYADEKGIPASEAGARLINTAKKPTAKPKKKAAKKPTAKPAPEQITIPGTDAPV